MARDGEAARSRAGEDGSRRRRTSRLNIVARLSAGRDAAARRLIAAGFTPNGLTLAGCAATALAGAALVIGAGHAPLWEGSSCPVTRSVWPWVTTALLLMAYAGDFFDGPVARLGGMATPFGAVLDSSLDRISDLLLFFGCAVHFALTQHITYVALSLLAAGHAVLISYIKARAENMTTGLGVGFWQRGERCCLLLAAVFTGHVPAVLWLLGTLPATTVLLRLRRARRQLDAPASAAQPAAAVRLRRGSAAYGAVILMLLAFILAGPWLWPFLYGAVDPLQPSLARFVSRSS